MIWEGGRGKYAYLALKGGNRRVKVHHALNLLAM